jgi:FkbH-like protein
VPEIFINNRIVGGYDELRALDLKGELLAGLSYTPSYAERLAHALARLLVPPLPKRGLITDLDDTLWAGIAGEIGPDAVSWDLEHKSQLHGLYQQSLRALAEQGVLIAAVSKNDPEIVEAVFRRSDLLLPRKCVFPVEAHWKAKSDSVTRILRAWNLHPDSVVFVDDGPSEIAEVKAAHPDMECIRFDPRDYTAVHTLLYRLRDLFAKQAITEEDGVRRESLRAAAVFREAALQPSFSEENFLRDAEAKITFDFSSATFQPRSLELVNKTNQFNLNGTRYTEGEWHTRLVTPGTFLVTTNYRDKYGPLGIISVLMGKADETGLTIKTWVMSCRAFGRRIEYQCLRIILDRYRVPEILLEFSPTSRNHYLQEFLESISGQKHDGSFRISRDRFLDQCPRLYHQVDIHDE